MINPKQPRLFRDEDAQSRVKSFEEERRVLLTQEPAAKPPKLEDSEGGMDSEPQSRNCGKARDSGARGGQRDPRASRAATAPEEILEA